MTSVDYKGQTGNFPWEIQASTNLHYLWREFSAWDLIERRGVYDFTLTDEWKANCEARGETPGFQVHDYEDFSVEIQCELQQQLQYRYPKAHVVLFTMPAGRR